MEESLRIGIADFIQREVAIDALLFSGHSAGGAVAQIFYAMSMSSGYRLRDTTSSRYPFSEFRRKQVNSAQASRWSTASHWGLLQSLQ